MDAGGRLLICELMILLITREVARGSGRVRFFAINNTVMYVAGVLIGRFMLSSL